ncbi:SMI1/KNR4 family protein [Streptomyces sp. NEAU-Y11]|nr:SMI1/KNR4 family protein [Streptomyces sp. NEAU-Y11]
MLIRESWTRFAEWLELNAPMSFANLKPPAQSWELSAAEASFGFTLHEDVTTLLHLNNGTLSYTEAQNAAQASFFFPGNSRLVPISESLAKSVRLRKILTGMDSQMVGRWWHPCWVPIAVSSSTDALFVDHRPGKTYGTVGTFLHDGFVIMRNMTLRELLEHMAAISDGRIVFDRYPALEDSQLRWRITY